MVGEQDLAVYLSKFDKKYWLTYKVLDILQKVSHPTYIRGHSWVTLHETYMLVTYWLASLARQRRMGLPF